MKFKAFGGSEDPLMFFSLKINTGSVGSEDPLETLFAKLDPRIRQDPLGSVVADRTANSAIL